MFFTGRRPTSFIEDLRFFLNNEGGFPHPKFWDNIYPPGEKGVKSYGNIDRWAIPINLEHINASPPITKVHVWWAINTSDSGRETTLEERIQEARKHIQEVKNEFSVDKEGIPYEEGENAVYDWINERGGFSVVDVSRKQVRNKLEEYGHIETESKSEKNGTTYTSPTPDTIGKRCRRRAKESDTPSPNAPETEEELKEEMKKEGLSEKSDNTGHGL